MILQKMFDLATYTYSKTAEQNNIDNSEMTDAQFQQLQKLHTFLIELRERISGKYNKPINFDYSSVFRSLKLNEKVKGSKTSQHCLGEAADLIAIGLSLDQFYNDIKELAKSKTMIFGQVIKEKVNGKQWVHVSLPRINKENNMFMVTTDGKNYTREPLT